MSIEPNTFVRKAPDSDATCGAVSKAGTIPGIIYEVLQAEPYKFGEREP